MTGMQTIAATPLTRRRGLGRGLVRWVVDPTTPSRPLADPRGGDSNVVSEKVCPGEFAVSAAGEDALEKRYSRPLLNRAMCHLPRLGSTSLPEEEVTTVHG